MPTIRAEQPADTAAVRVVVDAAFDTPEEGPLVSALRASEASVPDLSLVAVADGAIVGHVLFTEAAVAGLPNGAGLVLAPLAVAPNRQGRGIGSALVEAGLDRADDLGYTAVVVLGSPDYYSRFGFRPATDFGLENPWGDPHPAFQALELTEGALADATGAVVPAPPFDDL